MDPTAFAREWIAAWNHRDLDRILAHYHDDVTFSSPLIVRFDVDATGTLHGKPRLRDYFAGALERSPNLRFTLRQTFVGVDSLALLYDTHRGWPGVETMALRGDLVVRSWAHYPVATAS